MGLPLFLPTSFGIAKFKSSFNPSQIDEVMGNPGQGPEKSAGVWFKRLQTGSSQTAGDLWGVLEAMRGTGTMTLRSFQGRKGPSPIQQMRAATSLSKAVAELDP